MHYGGGGSMALSSPDALVPSVVVSWRSVRYSVLACGACRNAGFTVRITALSLLTCVCVCVRPITLPTSCSACGVSATMHVHGFLVCDTWNATEKRLCHAGDDDRQCPSAPWIAADEVLVRGHVLELGVVSIVEGRHGP